MINLLPPKQKEEILDEKKFRIILILEILVLAFLISLFLMMLSVKIYITGQAASQKILADLEKEQFEKSEIKDFEKEINSLNQEILRLNSFYQNQYRWSDLLENLSAVVPQGGYLNTISLNPLPKEEEKLAEVSLSGFSPTREALSDFKKRLETNSYFKEVSFPASNWVKSKDIDFSATLKVDL